jgi:acyl-homoserine-lactone acylase
LARIILIALFAAIGGCTDGSVEAPEVAEWQQQARNVEILRDDWGIPHVYGSTDADTVFGVMYAQAEDDFHRIETNYLRSLGRLAEAEGAGALYHDLRARLYADPVELKALFDASPDWLQALMRAWADGLNYFLHTHPEVQPRAIERFEPWMALSFSEGSIGGDIERIDLAELEAFYSAAGEDRPVAATAPDAEPIVDREPSGSNGFAIAPANTVGGNALLLINPHTSFFFRAEAKMVSEEGLNAYGAMTWGQFFVYQGFNDRVGWMHTSSSVDNIDEYLETISRRDDGHYYRMVDQELPLEERTITLRHRTAAGMAEQTFTVYRTHRGPIVRSENGKWVSVRLMHAPVTALMQSYGRTRATDLASYKKTMALHSNSSNNTVYADADGNIAYFHSNFVPRRDPTFDWSRPVDGTIAATGWGPPHSFDESPNVINPPNGWIQNTNNWPYSAAGEHSPRKSDYPAYMDTGRENPRGIHAMRVLDGRGDFTLGSLIEAAYSTQVPAFDTLVPLLVRAYESNRALESAPTVGDAVAVLGGWDRRWSVDSVATALAVLWGEVLWERSAAAAAAAGMSVYDYIETQVSPQALVDALAVVIARLERDFGTWRTPWGEINRFQRLTGDLDHPFDDAAPSIPVGFTSARWGSLASFGARPYQGSKRIYGTSGNSFVAVVEFGDRVRAKAITAGGQSGDPSSPHFNDQAERYSTGSLRDVYFYRDDLEKHVQRRYWPGQDR